MEHELSDTAIYRIQRAAARNMAMFAAHFEQVTRRADPEIHIDFCAGDLCASVQS